MEQNSAGLEASAATKGFRYARHCPEHTLLYQLVKRYYPELAELMADPCPDMFVESLMNT
jgi:hypothetical protein